MGEFSQAVQWVDEGIERWMVSDWNTLNLRKIETCPIDAARGWRKPTTSAWLIFIR